MGYAGKKMSKRQLETLLGEVRRQGCARAVGEPIAGINAMSAPAFDHAGNIALAITLIGFSITLPEGLAMSPRIPASWPICWTPPRAPEMAIM